jgi:hypothetical protein
MNVLTWRERKSESKLVASVWSCNAIAPTERTVLADPCMSIALIEKDNHTEVVVSGPNTESRSEFLEPGYKCTAIRLQPGVLLQGFPAQTDNSLTLPVDAESWFWFQGSRVQFPDFDNAELLVEQLHALGLLQYEASSKERLHSEGMSSKSYARLTKRTTGLSPYKLHQLQRIHQALRLLKQGVPAVTVAAELDFVDQAHLTRAVKQFLGHTPKELLDLPHNP